MRRTPTVRSYRAFRAGYATGADLTQRPPIIPATYYNTADGPVWWAGWGCGLMRTARLSLRAECRAAYRMWIKEGGE